MNVGLERALVTPADAVLLLTQDALITCDSIKELGDALIEHGAGIVGPALYTPDGSRVWSTGKCTSWTYATQHLTSVESDASAVARASIDGSVMLIARDVAERVRFNEGYFMYYEDSAYCRQAWARGRSVVVATRAHASSVPGGPSRPSAHAYLTARNRLYYAREHGRIASIRAFFGSLYAIARAIPKPGGTRFGDRALRRASVRSAWAMVRGVVDYWRRRTGPPPPVVAARDL